MGKRFGVARILNKRGYCSRSKAEALVRSGKVLLDGRRVFDPETPAGMDSRLSVDGEPVLRADPLYLAFHKPRGIVTTASDEKGRKTVSDLLKGKGLPHVFPVGRLDKASEGLLLITNDTDFANRILSPTTHFEKEYHVRVSRLPTPEEMRRMRDGAAVPPRIFGKRPERMHFSSVEILRCGGKGGGWLDIVLDEGKNREIRRLLEVFGISVLRLVRIRIGPWALGDLKPGCVKNLESPGTPTAIA